MNDIQISIVDREGEKHILTVPTDMGFNLMEMLRLQEPPFVEGTCGGMALCASCQVYLESDRPDLLEKNEQDFVNKGKTFNEDKFYKQCENNIETIINFLKNI